MLPKFLRLLAAALFYAFQIQAQAFEPGLLVRANGDTLRGEIENGFWVEPPAFIRFRAAPGGSAQVWQPRQLRAVSFAHGRYFRYEGLPINHAAEVQLDRLPRGYAPDVRTDSLLAEVLVEGPTLLLRVVSNGVTHYLLRRPNRPYLELSEQKYLLGTADGKWALADGNNYLGQLALYFGDCPAAAEAVQKAAFTAAGMGAVVQAYNISCALTPQLGRSWLTLAAPRRRLAFQGGLLVGGRYNQVASPSGLDGHEMLDKRPRPVAGLFGELFLPGRTTSIYGEFSLGPFRSRQELYSISSGITVGGVMGYEFAYADYSAWLGSARIGLRKYSSLEHSQQLVFGVSYELNRVFSPTFSTITRGSNRSPTETLPAPAAYTTPVRFVAQTIIPALTIGWRAKRLTLTLDGQRCSDYHETANTAASIVFGSAWSARLLASYRLGRNPDAARPTAAR